MTLRRPGPLLKWSSLIAVAVLGMSFLGARVRIVWLERSGIAMGLGHGSFWWTSWSPVAVGSVPAGWYAYKSVGENMGCWVVYGAGEKSFIDHGAASYQELPLWTLAAGLIPVVLLVWWGALRRGPADLCRSCRYSLAGLAHASDALVCPECGHSHPAPNRLSR